VLVRRKRREGGCALVRQDPSLFLFLMRWVVCEMGWGKVKNGGGMDFLLDFLLRKVYKWK